MLAKQLRIRRALTLGITICTAFFILVGCSSQPAWQDPGLSFTASEFRAALKQRVPDLERRLRRPPYAITKKTRLLAAQKLATAPVGSHPVWQLVALLSEPAPQGLGLEYDWTASATAKQTLIQGKGDCVALATVLVGLGRSLDWPIYFAEARTETPIVHEFEELTVLSGHMVVVVLSQEGRVVVDFLGLVDEGTYEVRPIDDLTAYAHLTNNLAGHKLIHTRPDIATDSDLDPRPEMWREAELGFELATRIQPTLGRAWNNLGIAYARQGKILQARRAYQRAVELNTIYGSAERNLTIMETRALHGTTLLDRPTHTR